MSGYQPLPILDMEHWTTEQVLAVYDLCQTISATLMARHEDQLIEMMLEIDQCRDVAYSDGKEDENLQLPFEQHG